LDTMEIVNVDDSLYPNTKFINVKMKWKVHNAY
jgi:hypothetical protein